MNTCWSPSGGYNSTASKDYDAFDNRMAMVTHSIFSEVKTDEVGSNAAEMSVKPRVILAARHVSDSHDTQRLDSNGDDRRRPANSPFPTQSFHFWLSNPCERSS
jgi:hypothetical protein